MIIHTMRRICSVLLALVMMAEIFSNCGTRHELACGLSTQAVAYYSGPYSIQALSALAGSASESAAEAWESPLCAALHTLMNESRTGLVSYAETILSFPRTDGSGGSSEPLRFYCDDFGDYNREQVWAEPHGAFYHDGAGCDLHHLRPTDPQANLVRGTQTFGTVQGRYPSCETWPDGENPVLWFVSDWNNGAGLVEVRDDVKGDVARILLYIYVTYGGPDGENRNLWSDLPPCGGGLTASDGQRVIESLDTLLTWMTLDPVDTWELGRNDVVQSLQGNRNVFIDYPELAFCLFDREIPDMPTPSGWAHSLHCTVTAVADPPEGGALYVAGNVVTAVPGLGWEVEDWTLMPADAAAVTREENVFTLGGLCGDCTLTVRFSFTDPCAAFGHNWDTGEVFAEPSCDTEGVRKLTCTVCGAERTEPIPAMGHDWHSQSVGPSCVRAGYELRCCWRCGAEVELSGAPALGHAWDAGTVTREPTQKIPGERSFRCNRCGAVRMEEIPFRFVDVQNEHAWYFNPVYWALHQTPPITSGTSPTHFSPSQVCTRAQIITFLWRAWGSPAPLDPVLPFADVSSGAYYRKAVCWAVEKQITGGTGPTTFSPDDRCTRGQVVTFLWCAAGKPAPGADPMPFTDVSPSKYYYRPVLWATQRGIVSGTSANTFSPKGGCTRAMAVTMLYRLYGP